MYVSMLDHIKRGSAAVRFGMPFRSNTTLPQPARVQRGAWQGISSCWFPLMFFNLRLSYALSNNKVLN